MISKKNLVILGAVVVILTACYAIAEDVFPANVVVETGSKNRVVGETLDFNITLDPLGQAIAGVQLDIYYNESLIRINNVTEGNLLKQNGASTFFSKGVGLVNESYNVTLDDVIYDFGPYNQTPGKVINIFDVIIGHNNVSTPGTIVILNVTIIGAGINGSSRYITTAVGISNVKIADPNASAVWMNATNGTAKILIPLVLTSASINPSTKTMLVGSYSTFSVTGRDQFGSGLYNVIWAWTTSDPGVAVVNQTTRKVTAVGSGIAYINATNGSVRGSSKVTVT